MFFDFDLEILRLGPTDVLLPFCTQHMSLRKAQAGVI